MNHSISSADRRTHLKVVVVGFLFAFFALVVGLCAHNGQMGLSTTPLVKAGGAGVLSGQLPVIR
jgi:hypothetical protein